MERDVNKGGWQDMNQLKLRWLMKHTQMCNVMDVIDQVAVDDLECIFKEEEINCMEEKLREVWTTDKREQKEQFQEVQAKNDEYFGYKICIT